MNVGDAFAEFLRRLELDETYDKVVQDRHAAVRSVVEAGLPGVRTQLIGSLQRHTRIDPLKGLDGFDIDILVELGAFERFVFAGGIKPDDALIIVETPVARSLRYRKMGAYEDQPTIIIPYTDGSKVEVVPAYRDAVPDHAPTGRAYWIPRNDRWVLADYDFDAQYIAGTNEACGKRLVPAIKMLRAWRRNRVDSLLRAYHLEVLAAASVPVVIAYYQQNGQVATWPRILAGFFACGIEAVKQSAKVPGSLSEAADYYLSPETRVVLSSEMSNMANWAAEASVAADSRAIEMWGAVFGKPFPGA